MPCRGVLALGVLRVLAATDVRGRGGPPVHSLPWYFGVVAFGIWAAAAVGFTILVRRRLRARAERRRDRRYTRRPTTPSAPIRDDRSLGSGGDLERW